MAGVNVQSGAPSGRRPVDGEINMIPMIDLLVSCISFLLITAVWSQMARVHTNAEQPGAPNTDPTTTRAPEPVLHVDAKSDGAFALSWRQGKTVTRSLDVPRQAVDAEQGGRAGSPISRAQSRGSGRRAARIAIRRTRCATSRWCTPAIACPSRTSSPSSTPSTPPSGAAKAIDTGLLSTSRSRRTSVLQRKPHDGALPLGGAAGSVVFVPRLVLSKLKKRHVDDGRPLPAKIEDLLRADGGPARRPSCAQSSRGGVTTGRKARGSAACCVTSERSGRRGSRWSAGIDEAGMSLSRPGGRRRRDLPEGSAHPGRRRLQEARPRAARRAGAHHPQHGDRVVGGVVSPEEIDAINIYWAGLLAMRRAVEGLGVRPEHLLIDGRKLRETPSLSSASSKATPRASASLPPRSSPRPHATR